MAFIHRHSSIEQVPTLSLKLINTLTNHDIFWVLKGFHIREVLLHGYLKPRVHKNGRLEEECVTPIEARSPVKIIELLLKIEHPVCA